jgi:hypothetical protein
MTYAASKIQDESLEIPVKEAILTFKCWGSNALEGWQLTNRGRSNCSNVGHHPKRATYFWYLHFLVFRDRI